MFSVFAGKTRAQSAALIDLKFPVLSTTPSPPEEKLSPTLLLLCVFSCFVLLTLLANCSLTLSPSFDYC